MATFVPVVFTPERVAVGKRLSSGNGDILWTPAQLVRLFRETCPFEVTWPGTIWDMEARYQMQQWCHQHCTGYWSDSIILRAGVFEKPIWIFQYDTDAVMFKLNLPSDLRSNAAT